MNKKIAVLSTFLIASLVVNAYGILSGFFTFTNIGSLGTDLKIGVYFDRECTLPISNDFNKDWEHVEIGTMKIAVVYVKNENAIPVTISATWANWYPTNLPDYATFTTDLYGTEELYAGESKEFDMHLTVYGNYTGPSDFTFDVVVQATEIVE